ncbi:MAG: peptidoglycan editing factor PgeF [Rhodovarius sp.]|nr:peptidoglycan editing factor PgeF [Rhodovarius sp.]MCX7931257.1 peptidoglycan editing factor PgeF [Rhodovarius sp.]MDW8315099.1 peptidoglycan editing factor PgeF [Rhodovarius sp.]
MITHPLLAGAPHGFFTREGGVSEGDFASLNCALGGADDPARVAENRAIAARRLGFAPQQLAGAFQVHGTAVAIVEEPWPDSARPRADALVTRRGGILLGVVTADCAPVLLLDRQAGVAGAAHAGWRGALAGVLEATVAAMRALGARRIVAVIGPCIGQASYEVRADLRDAVLARDPADARFFAEARPGHWRFDLAGYCLARLAAVGVEAAASGHDTMADPQRFFSHRRRTLGGGGAIGHQLSAIAVGE